MEAGQVSGPTRFRAAPPPALTSERYTRDYNEVLELGSLDSANNVTAAMTRTLELYFGTDKFSFEVTSLAPQAVREVRRYYRFSDAAQDVVDARVDLGIHFRFADVAARHQGSRVADWTFNHFLLPLGGRDNRGQDQW